MDNFPRGWGCTDGLGGATVSLFAAFALVLAAAGTATPAHPEAKPFVAESNAQADVAAALSRAKVSGKRVIVVLGANWCHDSRALAGWFASPRFAAMMKTRYEVAYVDIGMPQRGQGRNLDVPQRYGIKAVKGKPTVMILSTDGQLLNKKDAPKWRNAASRSEDDIFNHFNTFGE